MVSVFESYFAIGVFSVIAILFAVFAILGSRWFSPFKPNPRKLTIYECGEEPEGEAMIQFNFQYYIFALIFVIFDVLSILLLVWAVSTPALSMATKMQMIIVVGILFVALAYALRKERLIKI